MNNIKEVSDNMWILDNNLTATDCEFLINTFKNHNQLQLPGYINTGFIDDNHKKSTDLLIDYRENEECKQAHVILACALNSALEQISELSSTNKCIDFIGDVYDTGFQIQKTEINQGYDWHSDEYRDRILTFIWYLNDDFEGGHTDFSKQELSITPKTGSMLIFPAFWTHVHAGMPVTNGTKYIATGWIYRDLNWHNKGRV